MNQHPDDLIFSVSDFVAVLNQTLEFAYPNVTIVGELANYKISKNKWVYFDLKDEQASIRCFGTIYNLPGPLEDGLNLQVKAAPRLHPQFGFSLNIMQITPVGEGSIKRAALLLERKLSAEGLFDDSRKRSLPYPPAHIGLITSSESAAYHDFVKILNQRWGGVDVGLADVQVQGESAAGQIVSAVEHFNQAAKPPEILVIIRGGGSAEDLAAFNNELLVRAVATSRIPTLVAIGHEVDISLVEMAADKRASTPSNAVELLTPDKQHELLRMQNLKSQLGHYLQASVSDKSSNLNHQDEHLATQIKHVFSNEFERLKVKMQLLDALSPNSAMKRGYAIIRANGKLVKSAKQTKLGEQIDAMLTDGQLSATVNKVKLR